MGSDWLAAVLSANQKACLNVFVINIMIQRITTTSIEKESTMVIGENGRVLFE